MTWEEKHGVYRSNLGKARAMSLVVEWTSSGFKATVYGLTAMTLTKRFSELEEAKTAVIGLAKRMLTEALADLE